MKQRITNIAVHQTSLVLAATYALLAVVFIPVLWLANLAEPDQAMPAWVILLVPVFYAVVGYLITALFCALYNVVAARLGGMEITLAPLELQGYAGDRYPGGAQPPPYQS